MHAVQVGMIPSLVCQFPRQLVMLLALALAALSCGGVTTKATEASIASNPRATRHAEVEEERSGAAVVERLDVNGDLSPDVTKYYELADVTPTGDKGEKIKQKVLVRKEIDVNFDGRVDIVEFYTGGVDKIVKEREELDLDLDGQVDEIRKFADGRLIEASLAQHFNGKIDTWMLYQMTKNDEGKDINRMVERRRDHNGDGLVDVWEYYTKGELKKIGRDNDGDGKPDQYQRVDEGQR